MKPPPFELIVPASVEEAIAVLQARGEDAKVLAGGQSLVPLLNFRLARPRFLIDLNRIPGLAYVRERDGGLAIGAMTRQRTVERSPLVAARCPLLAEAMPLIGHFQIRNRGTIGGSLAHADPAAELPAVVTALGGDLVIRGPAGERVLSPDRFFLNYLTVALQPAELLVEVRLPPTPPRTGVAFLEVARRHGDFALVGVAAVVSLATDGTCAHAAVALIGVGGTPATGDGAARRFVGERPDATAVAAVARDVARTLTPDSDLHASAEYRVEVAEVLTRRALTRALERARAEAR